MDVTPMIDCVFLLAIFFVLVIGDRVLLHADNADRWAGWHHAGKSMTPCRQPYAQSWKRELAMSEAAEGAKMRTGRNP